MLKDLPSEENDATWGSVSEMLVTRRCVSDIPERDESVRTWYNTEGTICKTNITDLRTGWKSICQDHGWTIRILFLLW